MVPRPTKTAKFATCSPCKSSINVTTRRRGSPSHPSTLVALLKQACLGSTFPCSGFSSHPSRNISPKVTFLKKKQEKDLQRSVTIVLDELNGAMKRILDSISYLIMSIKY